MITKEMTMGEILDKYPFAAEVLGSFGLTCIGCSLNPVESLEAGALGHGLDDEQVDAMVKELNHRIENHAEDTTELANPTLEITEFAATKVMEIMKTQNASGGLRVAVVSGGCSGKMYQMDFDTKQEGDFVFEQNGVQMFVDPQSMRFLNGTSIDYVEGLNGAGFRLNNPNERGSCHCGKSVK